MAGALGGAFVSILAGSVLEFYKKAGHVETGYTVMFAIAACAYYACMDDNECVRT